MANEEHVKIVKQGKAVIDAFRKKNPDVHLDLSGANLSGANLSGADLSGRGGNLIEANLIEADLSGANLSEAKLSGANLSEAKLNRATLVGADLRVANLSEADLSGADLSEAKLNRATLVGADLSMADLRQADLNWAKLSEAKLNRATLVGADLSMADLRQADLSSANLSRVNLSEANLRGANLSEVDLIGADLSSANLSRVNLSRVNLERAEFANVVCADTAFADVDLRNVKNLDAVRHQGPSSVGIDTLYRSKGQIPDAFLRGCGVPEDFITFVPSLTAKPFEFYSCFISYSHEDKSFARRLHDGLQGRGIRCWLDEHEVLPGDDIHEKVDEGIKLSDKVLLCCSKHSLTSWWVDNEIEKAFKKEQQLMKQRKKKTLALIPLDLDGYIFKEWENGKKDQVLARSVAKFKGWKRNNDTFEKAFEKVVQALRTDDFRKPPPEPKL